MEFEIDPYFFIFRFASPFSAALREQASVENERVCVGDDLCCSVGTLSGVGKIHGVLNLQVECFDGTVGIAGVAEDGIIFG